MLSRHGYNQIKIWDDTYKLATNAKCMKNSILTELRQPPLVSIIPWLPAIGLSR